MLASRLAADDPEAPPGAIVAGRYRCDLVFRPRKVRSTSGGTAFVVHEPVLRGATAAMPSLVATTSSAHGSLLPREPWIRVLAPLTVLLALTTVAFGIAWMGAWSQVPDVKAGVAVVRAERPATSVTPAEPWAPPPTADVGVAPSASVVATPRPPVRPRTTSVDRTPAPARSAAPLSSARPASSFEFDPFESRR
jgi:hypothetical protein